MLRTYLFTSEKVISFGALFSALLVLLIPFSTAIAIITSGVVFLFWILSFQFLKLLQLSRQYQSVLFALLLIIALCIGLVYSDAPFKQSISGVNKYRELLLFIVLLPFFQNEKHRLWATNAFVIASVVTLFISYGKLWELIPSDGINFSYKSRITHGLMIAFFGFYCFHQAWKLDKFKYIWGILFLLSTYNVFFIVNGRTGQLIFIVLMLLFGMQRFSKKGILLSSLVICLMIGSFIKFSPKAGRISEGFSETKNYLNTAPVKTETSMGLRLSFWKNSIKLINEKPLFGHGTGSYEYEYQHMINSTDPLLLSGNPHNEYLMVTVQLGIIGLCLFLGFIVSLYRSSYSLESNEKWLLQGLVIAFIISNLFNSSLLDHTEGHWFLSLMALYFSPVIGDKNHGISKI